MSSRDRLEKECWRHRLPWSESTISMPLADAKRIQLVRPAAVPDRDSVANLASQLDDTVTENQAALTCTFRNGHGRFRPSLKPSTKRDKTWGAHERLSIRRREP